MEIPFDELPPENAHLPHSLIYTSDFFCSSRFYLQAMPHLWSFQSLEDHIEADAAMSWDFLQT
jgi:hypothetical protein